MDTKSTGSKFFAVVSFLLIPLFIGTGILTMQGHMPEEVFRYFILHENPTYTKYTRADTYEPDWSIKAFYSLEEEILALEEGAYSGYYRNNASRMAYYAKNLKTGKIITNCEPMTYEGEMTMDEFSLICNRDSSDWVEFTRFDGKQLELQDYICADRFSEKSWDAAYFEMAYKPVSAEYAGTYEIAFAFSRSYAYDGIVLQESYSYSPGEMHRHRVYVLLGLGIMAAGGLLFLLHLIIRKGRAAFVRAVGKAMHWFPLEIKAALLAVIVALLYDRFTYRYAVEETVLLCVVIFYLLYLIIADIYVNRQAFLKRSIVYLVYKKLFSTEEANGKRGLLPRIYRRLKKWHRDVKAWKQERMMMLPYQKRLYWSLLVYVIGLVCCVVFGVLWTDITRSVIPLAFMLFGIVILTFWLYKRYVGIITDIERIASQVRLLRGGNFDQKLVLPENSQLYGVAADLNNLQDGLKNEIDKRMVSEKMKVELITNVSHDLKTPLTSMINYIDLLKEEKLQPEHTQAYVKVLDEKSKRLKLLIENIFDISKATSGNMVINYGRLSMSELVNQALAECENRLELAELSIKKNYTDEKFYVNADGKMLWRITENILNNAVKYSLKGTRIYLELTEDSEYVSLTVKNIAGYEMNFTADSIVERFVRGDESRTTEGTGLGLSIVKSFIEAMGGKMSVTIDGDLFKISVCVKRYQDE